MSYAVSQFRLGDLEVFFRLLVFFAVFQVPLALLDLAGVRITVFGYATVFGRRLSNTLIPGGEFRAQALEGHPIVFGLVLSVAFILVVTGLGKISRSFRYPILALLAGGLIISGSRSAILCTVLGTLVWAFRPSVLADRLIVRMSALGIIASLLLFADRVVQYFFALVDGLSDSGSYLHRAGALESVPHFLSRADWYHLIVGFGYGSEPSLFRDGYLQQDGFNIVDNQIVTSLVTSGLLGLTVLIAVLVRITVGRPLVFLPLAIVLIVMLNTFDLLRWPGAAMLFFALAATVDANRSRGSEIDASKIPRPDRGMPTGK